LERNITALDARLVSEIDRRDAWRAATQTRDGEPFDLIFLDPPYRDSNDTSDRGNVRQYLARLSERGSGRALVVLHHDAKKRFVLDLDDAWRIADERRFGSSAITVFAGHA